uniref:Next to BRCA1 central domain-containing protein n=1 Tax=Romanomermis culicivorax TaxID=13658 RepID=A0A915HXM8_ROMCU
MISPATKGTYHSMWRLMTRQEVPFGDHIWCIITVDESGLLDLTQKLAATY